MVKHTTYNYFAYFVFMGKKHSALLAISSQSRKQREFKKTAAAIRHVRVATRGGKTPVDWCKLNLESRSARGTPAGGGRGVLSCWRSLADCQFVVRWA